MTPVTVTSHPHPDHIVVRVTGQLDTTNRTLLARILHVNLAAALPIIVDLGQTTFMDSTSLNVLLDAHTQANAEGSGLHLADLGLQVTRIMEITGTLGDLNVHDTVEQATEQLRVAALPHGCDNAA